MPGADGRIDIDTRIDSGNVEYELKQLQREIRNMSNEMRVANNKAMMPHKKAMLEVQKKYHDLASSMDTFKGTNKEFMGQVEELGNQYKKASDNMINANKTLRQSFLQTAGRMMTMTTQAQRISDNYERMKNPMYKVNQAGLAIADGMNKIANRGNAAVLSLKMLGPTASMKSLLNMQMMINAGLMRYNMVLMASMITGAIVYGALHKAAMKSNKGYAESFKTMIANIKKAFQPMVDVFAMVMEKVWNFINAIAVMIVRFNEAHPVLAKIIQGFLMLLPLLTLILAPLAVGIGLWNGMLAVFAQAWTFIGPLITGLASMMGTVLLVSAVIVGLVAGIMYLWKTNEGFRNAIITGWEAIKNAAIAAWNFILNSILLPVWNAIVSLGKQLFGQLQAFWKENGDNILKIGQFIWSLIKTYIINQITMLVTTLKVLFNLLSSIVVAVWSNIKGIISGAVDIILGIIGFFVSVFTGDWKGAWENAKKIIQGAWKIISNLATAGVNALLGIIRGLGKTIGGEFGKIAESFYKAGKGFMDMLVKGIQSAVGKVLDTIGNVAGKVRNFLPFSPAKTGPLSDLDKLDFGGPISDSILKAIPKVNTLLSDMLNIPAIKPVNGQSVAQTNYKSNLVVHLSYNGAGSLEDATRFGDLIEDELSKRFSNQLLFSGVKG